MKNSAIVFVLLALLACTGLMAQAPASVPAASATPLPTTTAAFLATLSAPGTMDQALPTTPTFLQSGTCTSDTDCPRGQLCCYPCGVPGCSFTCMNAIKNRCPLVP